MLIASSEPFLDPEKNASPADQPGEKEPVDMTDVFDADEGLSFEQAMKQLEEGVVSDDDSEPDDSDSGEADDEASDDEAGDEASDDEADDDEADDAEEEGEEEEEEEKPVVDESAIVARFAEKFEDLKAVKTVDELLTAYELERESNDVLVELFDAHPQLLSIVQDLQAARKSGEQVDLVDVARRHLGDFTTMPDPETDPQAYAQWLKEAGRREALQELEQRQAQERERQAVRVREYADQQMRAFQKEMGWDEKQLEDFRGEMTRLIWGDPVTGLPPADFPRLIWQGIHFQEAVERAKQEGLIEGKTQQAKELKARGKKGGDGLKKFSSGGRADQATTQQEKELRELAYSLRTDDDPYAIR